MAGIALIHGGRSSSVIWALLTPLLKQQTIAVDLPGRRDPSTHAAANFSDWAASVIADLDVAGIERAVLIGHSMGGGTLAAAARLYPERVAGIIYFSAVVAPHQRPFLEGLSESQQAFMRTSREAGVVTLARQQLFEEPITEPYRRLLQDSQTSDALAPFFEIVSLEGLARAPLGYVKLLRDRSIEPERQDRFIARLNHWRPCIVRNVDAGHMAMASAPEASAAAINSMIEEFGL